MQRVLSSACKVAPLTRPRARLLSVSMYKNNGQSLQSELSRKDTEIKRLMTEIANLKSSLSEKDRELSERRKQAHEGFISRLAKVYWKEKHKELLTEKHYAAGRLTAIGIIRSFSSDYLENPESAPFLAPILIQELKKCVGPDASSSDVDQNIEDLWNFLCVKFSEPTVKKCNRYWVPVPRDIPLKYICMLQVIAEIGLNLNVKIVTEEALFAET